MEDGGIKNRYCRAGAPFGAPRLVLAPLSLPFGSTWLAFGSILRPCGSIFNKKSCFLVPEFANHLHIAVCTPDESKFSLTPLPSWARSGTLPQAT